MWSLAATALSLLLNSTIPVDDSAAAPKYTVSFVGTSQELVAEERGVFHVEIRAAEGYKINAKAPLKISVSSETLDLEKPSLSHGDAKNKGDEHAPTFETTFTSKTVGTAQILGTASFFVCNADLCERKTEKIELSVKVKPAKKQG